MSRLDKWKKGKRIAIGIARNGDEELMKPAGQIWKKSNKREKGESKRIFWSLIQAVKELIFDIENDEPVFHVVHFAV